jgi:hypothetical protein
MCVDEYVRGLGGCVVCDGRVEQISFAAIGAFCRERLDRDRRNDKLYAVRRESEIDRWIKKNVSIGRSLHRLRIEAAMIPKEDGN